MPPLAPSSTVGSVGSTSGGVRSIRTSSGFLHAAVLVFAGSSSRRRSSGVVGRTLARSPFPISGTRARVVRGHGRKVRVGRLDLESPRYGGGRSGQPVLRPREGADGERGDSVLTSDLEALLALFWMKRQRSVRPGKAVSFVLDVHDPAGCKDPASQQWGRESDRRTFTDVPGRSKRHARPQMRLPRAKPSYGVVENRGRAQDDGPPIVAVARREHRTCCCPHGRVGEWGGAGRRSEREQVGLRGAAQSQHTGSLTSGVDRAGGCRPYVAP